MEWALLVLGFDLASWRIQGLRIAVKSAPALRGAVSVSAKRARRLSEGRAVHGAS